MTEFFMKEKLVSIHGVYHIYDGEGKERFQIKGKVLSLHDYTALLDMEGNELARIHKKLVSVHEVHFIEIDGREVSQVKSELLHPIHQKIDVPGLGWQVRGNLMEHDFTVVDGQENIRVSVHRKWLSIGEGYQVLIDREEDIVPGLALMVALERMMTDRRTTRTGGAAASVQQS